MGASSASFPRAGGGGRASSTATRAATATTGAGSASLWPPSGPQPPTTQTDGEQTPPFVVAARSHAASAGLSEFQLRFLGFLEPCTLAAAPRYPDYASRWPFGHASANQPPHSTHALHRRGTRAARAALRAGHARRCSDKACQRPWQPIIVAAYGWSMTSWLARISATAGDAQKPSTAR